MFKITQFNRNITRKILPTVSKCGREENTHPESHILKSIHLFQGCKLINYSTGDGNPLFYLFLFLFLSFSLSLCLSLSYLL